MPTRKSSLLSPAPLPGPAAHAGEFTRLAPYFTLDAWRGVAALWVVMLHACLPYVLNGHRAFLHNPVYAVSVWGQLGVTFFFVISGYCVTGAAYNHLAARKPLRRFCADRVRRIYPPYLAALLLTQLLLGATDFLQRLHLLHAYRTARAPLGSNAAFWLANLTLTQVPAGWSSVLTVAWSLSYEVTFYVIVACLLGLGQRLENAAPARGLPALTAGMALLTCGSLAWLCLSPATCPFPLRLWYQFGLGALLFLCFAARQSPPGIPPLRAGPSLVAALLLTALYAGLRADQLDVTQPGLGHPSSRVQALTTLVFVGLLYGLRPHDARLSKNRAAALLMRLGAFSYSLYLVHFPLLAYADAGLRQFGFTGGWYFVPYLSQIALAIVGGWLFFLGVERRFISGRQVRRLADEQAPGRRPHIAGP